MGPEDSTKRTRHRPEQIIKKLREADGMLSSGRTIAEVCQALGITTEEVIEVIAELFAVRGVPEHLRSDNGPEFIAKGQRSWLARTQAKALYVAPGVPWENGY